MAIVRAGISPSSGVGGRAIGLTQERRFACSRNRIFYGRARGLSYAMSDLDYNAAASRGRQQRLLAEMRAQKLDLVIVQQTEHVQWLTGTRYPWTMSPAAALRSDGHLTLAAPKKPILDAAADEVVHYEAQWHSTLRNDQRQASSVELLKALAGKAGSNRLG